MPTSVLRPDEVLALELAAEAAVMVADTVLVAVLTLELLIADIRLGCPCCAPSWQY